MKCISDANEQQCSSHAFLWNFPRGSQSSIKRLELPSLHFCSGLWLHGGSAARFYFLLRSSRNVKVRNEADKKMRSHFRGKKRDLFVHSYYFVTVLWRWEFAQPRARWFIVLFCFDFKGIIYSTALKDWFACLSLAFVDSRLSHFSSSDSLLKHNKHKMWELKRSTEKFLSQLDLIVPTELLWYQTVCFCIFSVPKPVFQTTRKSHNYMKSHHHHHQNQEILSPQHEELVRYMNDCEWWNYVSIICLISWVSWW